MIKSLLVAMDGSVYSDAAVKYGVYLAKKLGAKISGLNVIDVKTVKLVETLIDDVPNEQRINVREILQKRSESILEEFKKICKEAGLDPHCIIERGSVREKICAHASSFDFIVMAQRGEAGEIRRELLGGNAEHVVKTCNRPVLVSPLYFRETNNLLMAYDGSEFCTKALKVGCELATQLNLPLSVLTISDSKKESDKILDFAREFTHPYSLTTQFVSRAGSPDIQLLAYIKESKTDLLITGAYGHSRIRELILGSTTHTLMRRSEIPVLLYRE